MRIYRFLALLLVGLLLTLSQFLPSLQISAIAQTSSSSPPQGLYYLYQGQPISLEIRQDAIAVESQATERSDELLYQRLRRQLQPDGATRGDGSTNPPGMEINQLNDTTALINLSSRAPQVSEVRRVLQQDADNTILPVLPRTGGQDTLVLPNEIFEQHTNSAMSGSRNAQSRLFGCAAQSSECVSDGCAIARSMAAESAGRRHCGGSDR